MSSVLDAILAGLVGLGCVGHPVCVIGVLRADLTAKLVGLGLLGVTVGALLWDLHRD